MKRYSRLLFTLFFMATLAACSLAPTPDREETPTPTFTPTLTPTATPPAQLQISVYFTDRNLYNKGDPPFEVAVKRYVALTSNLPEAVLGEFFRGPTTEEHARGLELIASGFTGFSSLEIESGIAHLYLTGPCHSLGATYTIAQPLLRNLLQFDQIKFVKIYDSEGTTEEPAGPSNSIPFCLEP